MSNEALAAKFDLLKPGQMVTVAFSACMGHADTADGVAFRVGRRSYSKKWGVASIRLIPVDGGGLCPYKLMKRERSGTVSIAHGDLGMTLISID